jgi:hypothetical protein
VEAGDELQPRLGRDRLSHLPAHAAERAGDGYPERLRHGFSLLKGESEQPSITPPCQSDSSRVSQAKAGRVNVKRHTHQHSCNVLI